MIENGNNLPELPKGWIWTNFEALAEANPNALKAGPFGSALKKSFYVLNGYKIYGQEQVIREDSFYGNYYIDEERYEFLKSCAVKPGDILISLVGTIGKVLVLPEGIKPGIINPRLVKLSLEKRLVLADYIKAYLESAVVRSYFSSLSHGGTMDILNLSILKTLSISLPPLNEQRRIVSKIEALKARSQKVKEALEAIPPLLDQFRQSVLAAAFRGDLTADWREENPDVEPASVLLERICVERRRCWEKAELEKMKANGKMPKDDKWKLKYEEPEFIDTVNLPELPLGWCWVKFETVATIASNLVQPNDYPTHPHIAPDNVEKGSGRLLEYRTIKEDGVTSPKHLFVPGQIIYSKIRPYLSKCVLVDFEGLCSADMYPIDSHICYEYLFYYILSDTFINLIQKESGSRVVLPKANQQQVYAIPVPVPPLDEQIAIARKVNELLAYKDSIKVTVKNQLGEIEELQQSILAKAFRGELVPQNLNDEPASVLLERIRTERTKREAEAKATKKSKGKTTGQRTQKAKQQDSESIQLGLPGVE